MIFGCQMNLKKRLINLSNNKQINEAIPQEFYPKSP